MGDDYFARCAEAQALGDMRGARERRRCEEQGITEEMKQAASDEMAQLYEGLMQSPPGERLRRYERMFELARIRGYLFSADPAVDLVRIRTVRRWMRYLISDLSSE